jgi:hypothetical protein
VDANPNVVAEYKAGKESSLCSSVGQIMKETRGSANPAIVQKILKEISAIKTPTHESGFFLFTIAIQANASQKKLKKRTVASPMSSWNSGRQLKRMRRNDDIVGRL